MKNTKLKPISLLLSALLLFSAIFPYNAFAHCDSMDGPVVQAAIEALETGNVDLVLIWVLDEHDSQIREAFDRTMKVRGQSEEVRELADMYFFETLVRLHREGEGAAYTGLIPEGEYYNEIVEISDRALETGSLEELRDYMVSALENGLHTYYDKALGLSNFSSDDIDGGREFVEAYVEFIHFVKPVLQVIDAESGHAHHH